MSHSRALLLVEGKEIIDKDDMVTDQASNMTKWIYLFLAQVQVISESYRC